MTIEQYGARAEVALASSQDIAVQRLTEWAHSAQAAYEVAEKLSQTSFVPAGYRGKAMELTAAILTGLEVGLQPMAAMRAFDPIQGQAAPKAMTLRAIVQSHGHEMVLEESNASRCRMSGKRRGSERWQTVTWTMERARDLGLSSKDGWKKQPTAMLLARATSELARLVAADALLGIPYSAEELADGGTYESTVEAETTAPAAPSGTRKMSRRPRAEPVTAEQVEPAAEPSEPVTDGRDHEGQRKAMFAAFRDVGFSDARSDKGRADRLDYIGQVIGREVETTNDMSWEERSQVIDALKADVAGMTPGEGWEGAES